MSKETEGIRATDSRKELAKKIAAKFSLYMNANRNQRLEWLICAAFARGVHYAVIDNDNDTLITPRVPDGRKRSKSNKIGMWVKNTRARLTAVRPDFEVEPIGAGDSSIQASLAGTAYLQHSSKIQKWIMKRHQIANLCAIFGNCGGYIRDVEDPTRLVALPQYDEGGYPLIIDGKEQITLAPVEDVEWGVIPPHNILCSSSPGDLDDKDEILLVFKRSLSYFPDVYGLRGEDVRPDSGGAESGYFDLSILSNTKATKETTGEDFANEIVYLKKPTENQKDGLFCIYAGGEILVKEKWMYERMTDYPLVHFRYGPPEPGEFWTQSPIKDQIQIQRDRNEVASIILENISNMGHKKWMNPIGSGVKSVNDLSGEIIDYLPGLEPHQSQVAPLPYYEVNYLAILDRDLEDIQMLHSTSKGAGTPNVRSRIGLDKLTEEDDTPLAVIDDYFEAAFSSLGEKILRIASEKLTRPRLVKYIGEGRRRTIDAFTKEMLDGAGRVNVRMVDGFLRNKGRTQSLVLEMFNAGMVVDNLGNPDARRAQKLLQFAIPEMVYWKEDQQRDIQYEENEKLLKGEAVEVAPWEYHFVHLDVLEEMMNGVDWKSVMTGNQRVREVTMAHWEGHKQLIMQALNQTQKGQPLREAAKA